MKKVRTIGKYLNFRESSKETGYDNLTSFGDNKKWLTEEIYRDELIKNIPSISDKSKVQADLPWKYWL
ncbi:MAG: hypothetical protein H6560_10400 [Lewinellaceae bacterium]|nr:hypothetical protein [Lewinellaceae bacterium]